MKYMLLIHSEESRYPKMSEADMAKLMEDYGRFTAELQAAGAMEGADRLRPTSTATTVRVRDGKLLTTDGPFAETKEQLGGYYLIKANDLDEAVKWAAKVPSAKHGCVEVRPVWE